MNAGRELDALVAEKVFGAEWWRSSVTGRRALFMEAPPEWFHVRADGSEARVGDWLTYGGFPAYSTDIAAAWEVVEKVGMFQQRWEADLNVGLVLRQAYGDEWAVTYRHGVDVYRCATAPHAICLMALALVGAEVPV